MIFNLFSLFTGPSLGFPIGSLSIVLLALGVCSTVLICIAFVALCRRHEKTNSHTKTPAHDDALCHGAMLISEENGVLTNHDRRFSDEDPDPDIIPNVRGKYITFS